MGKPVTIIRTSTADIRAHRPDAAMMAQLRNTRDQDIRNDTDEATGASVFRIREAVRSRIVSGAFEDGDVAAFRAAFCAVSQAAFAEALGLSVDTLQGWEQGHLQPDGPAKALLRLLARHPRLLMHDLMPAQGAG